MIENTFGINSLIPRFILSGYYSKYNDLQT